ncbi:FliI/YscN family ATPase [Sulfobacillus harzensis]|uniref:FliI/YscN family ATPase n=1 Tax=Sulfobacillus harzensis TaxID=2729629 RepID=A0A7Y0L6X1_9FIRM|nr:FliI/YscN family ATPase [Sulfobacillus harzensis]NMP23550.1 FliI/YscN family ATPase [Sulfobacillus harzensis]
MIDPARIERIPADRRFQRFGRIEAVRGLSVVSRGPRAAIGEILWLMDGDREVTMLEVSGFLSEGRLLLTPYGDLTGLRQGMMVRATGRRLRVPVGTGLLGRVVDGTGAPLDGKPPLTTRREEITPAPIAPLERKPIDAPLWTGIRTIDGILTLGRGQRVGIFAGAGVGKTTLLQQMLEGTSADVAVVALIGERGREISEFYHALAAEALARTAIIAATSDSPAILRLRAMDTAFRVAEAFRQEGRDVMMVVDSLTRVAMAQSEVGLESGELAAVRGYTPSVFHLLPRVLERAGRVGQGSITGIFTVLLDSDDPTDPIGDAVRGILDGNLYLDRRLAERDHFPAIDVLKSLSRVMPDVTEKSHQRLASRVRRVLARLDKSADLVMLGAYHPGSDPILDACLRIEPDLTGWMTQAVDEFCTPEETLASLEEILSRESALESA